MADRVATAVFDADNHFYETADCFTRHIESEFKDRTIHFVTNPRNGFGRIHLGDEPVSFLHYNCTDYVAPPGALLSAFASDGETDFKWVDGINAYDHPEMTGLAARLRTMDQQGIEGILQLPTTALAVMHDLTSHPDVLYPSLRAFNRWLEDQWGGYGTNGRVYTAPLMSLSDVDEAVLELDRVLTLGARVVHLSPGPQAGKSPADPSFDPFWSRVNEAGIAVVFHISNSGYQDFYSSRWSEDPGNASHKMSPLQWAMTQTERPIVDTLLALVHHNLFGRFPNIRVMSIENGSDWLPHILKVLDKSQRLGRNGPMLGGPLAEKAGAVFKEHVYIAPFPEEDVLPLIEIMGANHVLFGSDWPHPEGLADPASYAERLAPLGPEVVEKVMYRNSVGLLGAA